MPTVVHIISQLTPYGGTANKYLAWLRHSKFKHVFILHEQAKQDNVEMQAQFISSGADVTCIGKSKLLVQAVDIWKIIKQYNQPIVLGHYFRGAVLALIVSKYGKMPLIVPLHGSANFFSSFKLKTYRAILHLARKVIYNSHFTAASFQCIGNHEIIYNGCSFEDIVPSKDFSPNIKIKLLGIGGLIKAKQYDLLLNMMKYLPEEFSLTIMGDGPERTNLENLIVKGKLAGRVFLKGYVRNAAEEFRKYDIFLHPSIDESFGLVVAEALFSMVPVVVTDRCATYEVIGSGKYGWISDADSPKSWAETVMRIATDPEATRIKVHEGREWAIRMFSDKEFSRQMDGLISDTSAGNP